MPSQADRMKSLMSSRNQNQPAHQQEEIKKGGGLESVLGTAPAAQAQPEQEPVIKEKPAPVERQSVRIRKDLLLKVEEVKLTRKKQGQPATAAELVEEALEQWLASAEE